MIDVGLKVLDLLKDLLATREKNRAKVFQTFVEPMYRDAEEVFKNYLLLLQEVALRLERREPIPSVIRWLEEKRLERFPVRIKMRALLREYDREPLLPETGLSKFQKGVWGLMKGGLALFEEGHAPVREYGWQDHTVLDLMYYWVTLPASDPRYERCLLATTQQAEAIRSAWQDVADGYAELKRAVKQ